jgi:phosphotransferase system HPr (HPr) family protein
MSFSSKGAIMYCKEVDILNPTGLHARAAASFSRTANQFEAEIIVKKTEHEIKEGNAKSLLSIVTMGIEKGAHITICANGDDEITAVETLITLIKGGFGEV